MLFVFIDYYKYKEFSQDDALKITLCCLNNSQLDPENTTVVVSSDWVETATLYTAYTCVGINSENVKNISGSDIVLCLEAGDVLPSSAINAGINAMSCKSCVTVSAESVFKNITDSRSFLKFVRINDSIRHDTASIFLSYADSEPEKNVTVSGVIVPASFNWENVLPNHTANNYTKRNVWAFCAGHHSNDFRGNPKYLFLYLNEKRSDIYPYWLCDNLEIIALLRSFGLIAFKINTPLAERVINETGVLVAEVVKQVIPAGLEDVVFLNLWHGVGGVKNVERAVTTGVLTEEIAKKYIQKNSFYRTHELYLAPSLFIEKIAIEQLGLTSDQIIRAGYPRCQAETQIQTFEHNKFYSPELPSGVRFAAYIPTYRANPKGDLFSQAIPDMERLVQVLKKEKICLIFKMHPLLTNEFGFKKASEVYKDCPYLYFWDNRDDFYEIINKIDLCIMDYSSMFTDFIASGCRHFIRYAFDFTGDDLEFPLSYDEATLGRKCTDFDELLEAFSTYENDNLDADLKRIGNLYWEYADKNSFEKIIDSTLAYSIPKEKFKTLYSFDIFDTLISRKGLTPQSIFYKVRERLESIGGFPKFLIKNYPVIRKNAELNVREYYNRSLVERNSDRTEISFHEIIARIKTLYELTDEQSQILAEYEKEAELEDVIAIPERVSLVKKLISDGETVILISDMYHDKNFIRQMLSKVDPQLAEIPLFLSNETGYQKSSRQLFIEVYRTYGTEYSFDRWVHTGDNPASDVSIPKSLHIRTNQVKPCVFNEYESSLVEKLDSYDAYLIAASLARFREKNSDLRAYFAYAYVSFLWVPYLHWALSSCIKNGDEIVYFVSRDGHQFKLIADAIKSSLSLDLETKYIYASRRTWRIPSFYDHIDIGFWGQGYGNVAHVSSFTQLLKGLEIDADTFYAMFPSLSYLSEDKEIDSREIVEIAKIIKVSEEYEKYLLNVAEKQRIATCGYLKQEIDPKKQFSIIEYWGRGYTQENFTRLWQNISGRRQPTVFYYSRSTLPSDEDNIRVNYTSNTSSQAFIESIFSCINYKTIQKYECVDGRWQPVIEHQECDQLFFECMEEYLPLFAKEYCSLPLTDRENTGRALIDFAIDWHRDHPEWAGFKEILACQVDSVQMFGERKQYAPALTNSVLDQIDNGLRRNQVSKNIAMSYYRASQSVQSRFRNMFQIRAGEPLSSGMKLSKESIAKNIKAVRDLDLLKQRIIDRQRKYDEACRVCPVQNLVLVLTMAKSFNALEYSSLQKVLDEQHDFQVRMYALGCQKLPFEVLASAKYIVAIGPLEYLSELKLRNETCMMLSGNVATSYFYRGLSKTNKLRDIQDFEEMKQNNDVSFVHVPSAVEAERAPHIYSLRYGSKILQTGCVVTDCYFSDELRSAARDKLLTVFPESAGKKIICYVPLYRMRNNKSKWLNILDMEKLSREIGDKYAVTINLNGESSGANNIIEIPGFSKDLSGLVSVRELMLAADVIVADYRDTTFEAALTGVPVFLTSGDHIRFDNNFSVFAEYEEMMFGVPINDTHEFIEHLRNLDKYDWSYRDSFVRRFLTMCDGHSAERLVDTMEKYAAAGIPQISVVKITPHTVTFSCENVCNADVFKIYGEKPSSDFTFLGDLLPTQDSSRIIEVVRRPEYLITAVKDEIFTGARFITPPECDLSDLFYNLELLKNEHEVYLRWSSNAPAKEWIVKAENSSHEKSVIARLPGNSSEWKGFAVNDDVVEYYIEAEWSEENYTVSSGDIAATVVTVKKWTKHSATLTWNDIPSADRIEIYECSNNGEILLSELKGGSVGFVDNDFTDSSKDYHLKALHYGCAIADSLVTIKRPELPQPPEKVTAILSDNKCFVSWIVDPMVCEYRVYPITQNKERAVTVVSGTDGCWCDTEYSPLVIGYKVESLSKNGDSILFSGYSSMAKPLQITDLSNITVDFSHPLNDLELSISKCTRKTRLFKWKKIPSVQWYELYIFDEITGKYELVSKIQPNEDSYKYITRTDDFSGKFQLLGVNADRLVAIGVCKCESMEFPSVPQGIIIYEGENGRVLSWNAESGVKFWNIRTVSADNKQGKNVAKVDGKNTKWVDSSMESGVIGYRMEAVKIKKGVKLCSGFSSPVYIENQKAEIRESLFHKLFHKVIAARRNSKKAKKTNN